MKGVVLQADERVLAQTRKHWIILVRDSSATVGIGITMFALLGLITLPNALNLQNPTFLTALAFGEILWILLVWMALIVIWTNYYLDLWIVTNRRIVNVDQVKLFQRMVTTWKFENIQEITTETRNPLQTFFNYGFINIRTAGPTGRHARMEGIPHPDDIAALMLKEMEKYRALEETTKKQEALLHTVSHEVKAHLTKDEAAFASIVEGDYGEVPEKLKTMVKTALAETRSGVAMVMNLLSSSDFKTGAMRFKIQPFDFSATVQRVFSELKAGAEQKGLSITCSFQNGSYTIRGDEEKLREHVVRNLVDNAIHYTLRGEVRIRLLPVENAIVLIVTDTGIGIPTEDLPKLFTEGGKGVHSTAINPGSTGFGLSIAKQIVEAHGGAIWAESEGAGRGSTFYVALPAPTGVSGPTPAVASRQTVATGPDAVGDKIVEKAEH